MLKLGSIETLLIVRTRKKKKKTKDFANCVCVYIYIYWDELCKLYIWKLQEETPYKFLILCSEFNYKFMI